MRSLLRTLPLAGGVTLLLLSACTNTTTTCDETGTIKLCGDACVDLSKDPNHCGGCDQACEEGLFCLAGSCGCPGGGTSCFPDVYAPCFQAGTVEPLLGPSRTVVGGEASGIEGP